MILIIGLALWVIGVTSALQVASFFIGYFGAEYGLNYGTEFWNTGNFWAWVLMLLITAFVGLAIKLVALIVNNIVAAVAVALDGVLGGILTLALIGVWIVGSIVGGITLFNWFASFPELTDWFVPGNWFTCGLVIIGVWGLVARLNLADD